MAEDRTPASILLTAGSAPLDLRTILRHQADLTNFPEYSPRSKGRVVPLSEEVREKIHNNNDFDTHRIHSPARQTPHRRGPIMHTKISVENLNVIDCENH